MNPQEDHEAIRPLFSIDIKKLDHESRKFLYLGLLLGIAFHIFVGAFITYRHFEIQDKPITAIPFTLITVAPRITEPYEIPQPEPRRKSYVTKQFRQGVPSRDIESASPEFDEATPSMMGIGDTEYDIENRHTVGDGKALPGPLSYYQGMKDTIERRPKGRISVTDEMISISDLDTGQFKSMLILDPSDPLNTKGYVHIPVAVEGIRFKPNPHCKDALMHLAESFYKFTGITLKLDHSISLSSTSELMKYPFIYMPWDVKGLDFSAHEANNLRTFFTGGGFALAEVDSEFFSEFYDYINETFGDEVQISAVPDNVYASLIERPRNDRDAGVYIDSRLCVIHTRPYYEGYAYAPHWMIQDVAYIKWGINILYYALMQSPKTEMLVDDSSRAIKNSRQWWDYEMQKKYNEKFEVQ